MLEMMNIMNPQKETQFDCPYNISRMDNTEIQTFTQGIIAIFYSVISLVLLSFFLFETYKMIKQRHSSNKTLCVCLYSLINFCLFFRGVSLLSGSLICFNDNLGFIVNNLPTSFFVTVLCILNIIICRSMIHNDIEGNYTYISSIERGWQSLGILFFLINFISCLFIGLLISVKKDVEKLLLYCYLMTEMISLISLYINAAIYKQELLSNNGKLFESIKYHYYFFIFIVAILIFVKVLWVTFYIVPIGNGQIPPLFLLKEQCFKSGNLLYIILLLSYFTLTEILPLIDFHLMVKIHLPQLGIITKESSFENIFNNEESINN